MSTDYEDETPLAPTPRPGSNLPEFSVGDLARAMKRTLENEYGFVRVRGEISQPKRHSSGHCYLRLKDDTAVLESVIWRGAMAKIAVRPEEGMEVIAQGRITTYPGRSQYQLVIERLELAGEGALLKLLEERKRRLTAEGLFDPERKRPIPFLPGVIGVVTSPTGAVIRDILHRLADRFPRHVLVWPVAVQGEGAAAQVTAAIQGFNALPENGPVPRPDLIIVARGGGSLEDLMAFNEENVVRAAAASTIPLISAVGHETDTTLIDHASDKRAPTPTAAAEMAVPVRAELLAQVLDDARRLVGATQRLFEERRVRVEGLARGLGDPRRLLDTATQRLDDRAERLGMAAGALVDRRSAQVAELSARLRHPREVLRDAESRLDMAGRGLRAGLRQAAGMARARFDGVAERLSPAPLTRRTEEGARRLEELSARLARVGAVQVSARGERLSSLAQLLNSYSHQGVLKRGFALVRDADGKAITSAAKAEDGAAVTLEFHDGSRGAVIGEGVIGEGVVGDGAVSDTPSEPPPQPKPKPAKRAAKPPEQGSLF